MATVRRPAGAGRPRAPAQLWKPTRFPAPWRGSRSRRAIVASARPQRRSRTVPGGAASNAVVAPGRDGEDLERIGRDRETPEAEEERFDWAKQWYPVASLAALEEARGQGPQSGLPRIQRQTVLGRDIVLWKDAEGEWRAAEDRCAHRQAALSLGTVRPDGTLACRFHGWCFNGRGDCTHAPQASEPALGPASGSGSGSKIAAFPTLEAHGLLWVWPDDSPTSWIDSAARMPTAHKVTDTNTEWTILDVPSNYVTAVDNTMSVGGSNYTEDGQNPLAWRRSSYGTQAVANLVQTGDTSANRGFSLSGGPLQGDFMSGHTELDFKPPCLVTASVSNGASVLNSALYHTPLNQGRTRLVFGRSVDLGGPLGQERRGAASEDDMATLRAVVEAVEAVMGFLKALPLLLLPGYVRTSIRHLRTQEDFELGIAAPGAAEIRGSRESVNWRRYPIVPPPPGVGVAAFRSWLNRFAGGEPAWFSKGNSQGAALTAVHSRWESHTKSCPACRKSLNFMRGLEAWLPKAAAFFLALTLLAAKFRSSDPQWAIALWGVTAATFWAFMKVQKLRCNLLEDNGGDYVENENRFRF